MAGALILAVIFLGIAVLTYLDNSKEPKTPPLPGAPAALPDGPTLSLRSGTDAAALTLELPEPARTRAWQVLCLLQDAGAQADPADARARYLLTQTRDSYLPDTLRAYLSLTPGARRHLLAQGQNPEALLEEQLSLLTEGVRETLRRDHAAADRLLTQGRFLRERFGEASELRLPER